MVLAVVLVMVVLLVMLVMLVMLVISVVLVMLMRVRVPPNCRAGISRSLLKRRRGRHRNRRGRRRELEHDICATGGIGSPVRHVRCGCGGRGYETKVAGWSVEQQQQQLM